MAGQKLLKHTQSNFVDKLYVACAATECYNPEWEVIKDQNSVGASQYHGARSVQECLDHCGSQSNCVAADVDLTQDPPACWPHLSADDLLVYTQQGTNQYRLTNRCVNTTVGMSHVVITRIL